MLDHQVFSSYQVLVYFCQHQPSFRVIEELSGSEHVGFECSISLIKFHSYRPTTPLKFYISWSWRFHIGISHLKDFIRRGFQIHFSPFCYKWPGAMTKCLVLWAIGPSDSPLGVFLLCYTESCTLVVYNALPLISPLDPFNHWSMVLGPPTVPKSQYERECEDEWFSEGGLSGKW